MQLETKKSLSGVWLLYSMILCEALFIFFTYRLQCFSLLGPLVNLAATLVASFPYALLMYLLFSKVGHGERQHSMQLPKSGTSPVLFDGVSSRELLLFLACLMILRLGIPFDLIVGSSDAYRYIWDGLVLTHGFNPYSYAPLSEKLAELHSSPVYPLIFRPDMRTCYPPLAELWFGLSQIITPGSIAGFKGILLAHEAATVFLLITTVKNFGLDPRYALLYIASPLVVVQLFAGCHLDGLLLPWFLLGIHLVATKPTLAGLAWSMAAAVRPVILLGMPVLLLTPPWKHFVKRGAGFAVGTLLLYLPFLSAKGAIFESLFIYAKHWRFNGFLFEIIEANVNYDPLLRTKLYIFIAVFCSLVPLWVRSVRSGTAIALLSYFILSPTVYPWYLLPIALMTCLTPSLSTAILPAAITLSDVVFVEEKLHNRWTLPASTFALEYALLYGLLFYEIFRRRKKLACAINQTTRALVSLCNRKKKMTIADHKNQLKEKNRASQ